MPRKRNTILVADPDRSDREFLLALLRHHRYNVLEAVDYWDAVEIYRQHEGDVDLLVTALALPGDNGYELARFLLRCDDRLRALLVLRAAGADANGCQPMTGTNSHMLSKPLHADDVLEAVRSALATRRSKAARVMTGKAESK
jgi:CheY-like chemotaxis protein